MVFLVATLVALKAKKTSTIGTCLVLSLAEGMVRHQVMPGHRFLRAKEKKVLKISSH